MLYDMYHQYIHLMYDIYRDIHLMYDIYRDILGNVNLLSNFVNGPYFLMVIPMPRS